MNTPLSWIKKYVPELDCTPQEYMDAMTLTGTKVENFKKLDENLDKIVIGQITKIEKHPDADKLVICQVDVGENNGGTIQIVTGAPNVSEGIKVPVVLDGGRVAGGHDGSKTEGGIKIKKGKLRGIESFGMMCSIEELGSSCDMYPEAPENGIYIFSDQEEVGADAVEVLGLHDTVVEYEITSNRVDCYAVLGIAREAAATFRKPFCPPVVKETGNSENAADYMSLEVMDEDLCSRYVGRVVKNVKVGPSPWWMQRALSNMGIRPINNLVDITNYVMMEYGQPMHAYDYDKIAGHKICVRRAKNGETYTTLDGVERRLDDEILMICDEKEAVGIAGIMGGENSMITDQVTTLFFEAACFDGTNIRLSSKRLGLRTDASGIFEKGLDPNNAMAAMNRACQLIEEMGAGEVVGGAIDYYPTKREESRVKFEPNRINAILGTNLSEKEMLDYLALVELTLDEASGEIVAPTFRQDIHRTCDVAEEVARFFGYDKIPTTLPAFGASSGKLSYKLEVQNKLAEVARFAGYSEAMTFSFESQKVFDKLLIDQEDSVRNAVTIRNPLGEDYSVMRTLPLNGILTALAFNYNHRNKNVKLYELANIYLPKSLPLTELPDERMQFTLGFYGEGDFFTLKGVVEEALVAVGLTGTIRYLPDAKKNFLHPGRQALIEYEGKVIGYLGEVHPLVGKNYSIGERAYVAVLDLPAFLENTSFLHKFAGIAKYPAVSRDLSMVVPKTILAGQIEEVIKNKGGKLLENCKLFDIYEGDQIKEGYKSMAYSISFRALDHTLDDTEISGVMEKILTGLEKLGVKLRA